MAAPKALKGNCEAGQEGQAGQPPATASSQAPCPPRFPALLPGAPTLPASWEASAGSNPCPLSRSQAPEGIGVQ